MWGTFRPHLKSNAIWRPVAMYFTRWLIRITTLVRFCIFSVKGWFRGGHSYKFLRICHLVKYDFLHVWICMIKVVKYVRLAVRLGWNLLTVDSCLNDGMLPTKFCRATVHATTPLYHIFTRCDNAAKCNKSLFHVNQSFFVLTSHNNGMSDRDSLTSNIILHY